MKKLILLSFSIFLCLILVGCNNKQNTFSLDEEYYNSSSFTELDKNTFDNLISNKKTFAIFIYQPLCSASYEFNKVLTEFSKTYQISFYKLSFNNMKETKLRNDIKHYPSLVIYNKGKIIDYLDADSDEDLEYYKSVDGFKKWFSNYVLIKKVATNNNTLKDEVNENMKIDVELENVKYDENKVNIYFFWGNGCPHCEEEFKFLESIETEYGNYFTLNTFEVWYNKDNAKIMEQFVTAMKEEVTGIPYTIIGNKTFVGFSKKHEEEFLKAIKEQYQNSYDVYFDNSKK